MKILVTGICGRLGRMIAAEAQEQGVEIVGLDIVGWPVVKFGNPPAGTAVHIGSYEDMALLNRLLPGCDGLIHAGGLHGGNVETHDTGDFLQAHGTNVARMMDAARAHGVRRFALCSTMEVQIGRGWAARGAAWLDESVPASCDSQYSLSRRVMEVLAEQYSRIHDVSISCLRFMAFGYGDDKKAGPNLLARTVPARDVARATLLAVGKDGLRGEVFNIGPETPIQAADIGAAINHPDQVLDKYFPGASEFLRERGVKLSSSNFWPVTSIAKAALILGWRPQYTFEMWLAEQGWTPSSRSAKTGTHHAAGSNAG